MVLSAAGWQTTYTDDAGHKRFVFGGHAARVAGATFLALRGVPVSIIQLIGRWSSTAVERYTQQAPLAVAPGIRHRRWRRGAHRPRPYWAPRRPPLIRRTGRRRFVTPRLRHLRTSRPRRDRRLSRMATWGHPTEMEA